MAFRAITHWLAFAVYVAVFFTLPLALLWNLMGAVVGAILAVSFLILLGFRGSERIARRLKMKPLARAQAPQVFAMVGEYCRRLQMPVPSIGIIETPALNLALFGFSRKTACLAVTRGALDRLKRDELSALIGRELCYLWFGDVFCESWLSQFLSVLDGVISPRRTSWNKSAAAHNRRTYPFRLFLRQMALYPLTLIPAYFLKGARDAAALDLQSTRITRLPHALAGGLRRAEAMVERIPFRVPFSTRHLFLLSPPAEDPLARVFFGGDDVDARIRNVESKLTEVVALS